MQQKGILRDSMDKITVMYPPGGDGGDIGFFGKMIMLYDKLL